MTLEDAEFIKELLIKLDITIEGEHQNASPAGLMLLMDFTRDVRKESVRKALDILNKENPYEE